jgi:hypothetical protein|tara:strand:+ start:1095 stop:1334 length:240 start_codon:yes stop_codon:yes gene_type:complete
VANPDNNDAPIVIRQGGNGLGLVIAALILVGGAVYVVNVWSTNQKALPQGNGQIIKEGVESLKDSARQGVEAIKGAAAQ